MNNSFPWFSGHTWLAAMALMGLNVFTAVDIHLTGTFNYLGYGGSAAAILGMGAGAAVASGYKNRLQGTSPTPQAGTQLPSSQPQA